MEDWDNIKSSRNNNLIVNYLPHDIDDLALKVSRTLCSSVSQEIEWMMRF